MVSTSILRSLVELIEFLYISAKSTKEIGDNRFGLLVLIKIIFINKRIKSSQKSFEINFQALDAPRFCIDRGKAGGTVLIKELFLKP